MRYLIPLAVGYLVVGYLFAMAYIDSVERRVRLWSALRTALLLWVLWPFWMAQKLLSWSHESTQKRVHGPDRHP